MNDQYRQTFTNSICWTDTTSLMIVKSRVRDKPACLWTQSSSAAASSSLARGFVLLEVRPVRLRPQYRHHDQEHCYTSIENSLHLRIIGNVLRCAVHMRQSSSGIFLQ